MYLSAVKMVASFPPRLSLVGRSPTSTRKSGRLGDIAIPGFVPQQEFCSPIRLQHLSVCFQMLQSDWTTLKCCNLIGLQILAAGTHPGIAMSPNLPLFRVEVGLRPTKGPIRPREAWKVFFTFIFQLSGLALVAPLCFALHC